jgi:hypothetical protein
MRCLNAASTVQQVPVVTETARGESSVKVGRGAARHECTSAETRTVVPSHAAFG